MSVGLTVLVMGIVWLVDWALGVVTLAAPIPADLRPELALSAVATQAGFLLASWRQGRRIGTGNIQAGLGDQPIRRVRLVVALSLLQLIVSGIVLTAAQTIPAVAKEMKAAEILNGFFFDGTMWMLPGTVLIVILAPLGEELFFRGWLWTGLRRVWSPVAVSTLTGMLWLLLHVGNTLFYPLLLIPAAVMFSVIRHVGGSVRASILAHVVNNGAAAGLALAQSALQG